MVFGKVVEGMPVVMRMNDVEIVGKDRSWSYAILASAANRLIGEVVQSRRRPLLGPSPG